MPKVLADKGRGEEERREAAGVLAQVIIINIIIIIIIIIISGIIIIIIICIIIIKFNIISSVPGDGLLLRRGPAHPPLQVRGPTARGHGKVLHRRDGQLISYISVTFIFSLNDIKTHCCHFHFSGFGD